jgi:hypothetical protein
VEKIFILYFHENSILKHVYQGLRLLAYAKVKFH